MSSNDLNPNPLHASNEVALAQLASIVETSDDAIISKTLDGVIRSWNDAAMRLFGYSSAEAVGQPIQMLIPPERIQEEEQIIARLRKGERVDHFETVRICKSGKLVDVSVTISPIRDSSGMVVGASKIARNITERRQVERALKEDAQIISTLYTVCAAISELDLRKLMDVVITAATRVTRAEFGVFYYNAAAPAGSMRAICGNAPQELSDVVDDPAEAFPARRIDRCDDVRKDPRFRATVLSRLGSPSGVISAIAAPVQSRTGEIFGAILVGHSNAGAFNDRDEQVINGIVAQAAVAVDNARLYHAAQQGIDRERARAAQLEVLSRATLDMSLSLSIDAVMQTATDRAREMIGAQQAVMTLVVTSKGQETLRAISTAEQPASRVEVIPAVELPEMARRVAQHNKAIRLTQNELNTDAELQAVAGQLHLSSQNGWLAAPLIHSDGSAAGTVQLWHKVNGEFTADDEAILDQLVRITSVAIENARLYQALRQAKEDGDAANGAKDRFMSVLSHELRTPLTPALLHASALERRTSLPDDVRSEIKLIREHVEIEAAIIDDLLSLSTARGGKLQLKQEQVDANEILNAAIAEHQGAMTAKQIQLHLDTSARVHGLMADVQRLKQLFTNVIRNAVKFTPAGGTITITTSNDGDQTLITSITDTGIGMKPELIERLFKPFEQADQSLTRAYGGLGLGLTICRVLAELHGGEISATSAGPGTGSTFSIRLPAMKPVSTQVHGRKPRILLVEDNEQTLNVLARLLRGSGYEVQTASTLHDALSMGTEATFDLLISDIGLPDGSGWDLMSRLRDLGPLRGIALTGFGTTEDLERSRRAGFKAHLTKPVNLQMLEGTIKQVSS